ncbi:hypothetical protein FACS1894184_12080 [Clostridia bacterium]|nr:hypothetical protein FACS1894184_12080 [Clostridia bacterium]
MNNCRIHKNDHTVCTARDNRYTKSPVTRNRLIALAAAIILTAAMLPIVAPAAHAAPAPSADHYLVFDNIVRMFGGIVSTPPGHTAIFVPRQRYSLYSRNWTSLPASRWTRYDVVRTYVNESFVPTEYLVVDALGNISSLYPSQLTRAVFREISTTCDHQSNKCPFNYRVR